jgi:general secretion pathway protein G
MRHANVDRSSRRGFTLLEVVVFLAVASIGVGIALPMLGGGPRGELIDQAHDQMHVISESIAAYFRDNETFPSSLDDLVTEPNGAAEWLGPYIQKDFADLESANAGWKYDPWRTPYKLITASSTVQVIRSWGPNRKDDSGGGDDFDVIADTNPVMWEITKEKLLVINHAIDAYNNDPNALAHLSTQYTACLNELQAWGYLPLGAVTKFDYRYDGWGQWFKTVGNPVTKAKSAGPP